MSRLERALADIVGGVDGGLTLWEIACRKLERTAAAAGDDDYPFRSYPAGALNRLLVDVQDALRVATLAVELQASLDDADDPTAARREGAIAELLLERAHELADERMPLPSEKPGNSRPPRQPARHSFGTRMVER